MFRRLLPVVVVLGLPMAAYAAPSVQARASFERAEKALAAGDLDIAEQSYRDAIAASPGYAEALNGLGSALFKQGKNGEAVAQFKASIAADATFKLAHFNLGYVSRKTRDYATAAGAYEKYTALDPNDPDGFYGLAESYRNLNKGPEAVAAYRAFIEKEKRPSEKKWIDKAKEAISQLESANAVAPVDAVDAGTTLAVAPANALDAGLLAPAPALAATRIADGDKHMQEKNYREASFAYQDAVNADPTNVEALFKLGNAYAVLGYYSQAIDRWRRVAELSPDPAVRASAMENIAKAQAKIAAQGGDSPQAAGKSPGSGPVADSTRKQARDAYELGVKQIYSRDYAGALGSLSKAIQLEPNLSVAYVARGSAFIGLRRFAEAAADYQYAIKLDGKMASPIYGLAESYRAMGRVADARTLYEQYAGSTAPDVRDELKTEARMKAERLKQ